jgi:hypothetical protein
MSLAILVTLSKSFDAHVVILSEPKKISSAALHPSKETT